MNPDDPESAQQIVADYARLLESQDSGGEWPGHVDALPYPKATIKTAIRTSVSTLATLGHLTADMREFLEAAYVSLADYVPADLARLLGEYQRAGNDLAADGRLAREKTGGPAWRTLSESGKLAGEIARSIASEADSLREEFRAFSQSS